MFGPASRPAMLSTLLREGLVGLTAMPSTHRQKLRQRTMWAVAGMPPDLKSGASAPDPTVLLAN
jgi:hypothetical protein